MLVFFLNYKTAVQLRITAPDKMHFNGKVYPFPVALAGDILVTKEVWKSSEIWMRVHHCFKLVIYAGLRRMIKIILHKNRENKYFRVYMVWHID